MSNRLSNAAILPVVVTASILLATLLLLALVANQVFAQEEQDIDYAENGTGPVATYTASDPEGLGIGWDVTGTDAAAFSIAEGVLRFKKSPNYEAPTDAVHTGATDDTDDADDAANNNVYVIMVRITEVRPVGDESPAQSTAMRVVVTVTNEDEPGAVTLSRLQTRVGASGLNASLTDPDGGSDATPPVTNTAISSGITWQWSTAKVSRPELGNDDHWQPAAANQNTGASYTPDANDERKSLRVKASYTDGEGAGKVAYVLSDYPVLATLALGTTNDDPVFPGDGDYTRELPEDAAVGADVGAPVRATDANSSDILTYVLTGANVSSFSIDKATGQITVASALDFEAGGISGVYTVTVTAYDPSNAMDGMDVTITATDVNEKPAVAGMAEVSVHAEKNGVEEMNTYVALAEAYTPSDGDAGDDVDDLTLSLSGDDADAFELGPITDVATGRRVLTFEAAPNFEAPTDADGNNVYKVTVVATDDEGLTGEQAVTIIVTNVDETGAVTLSSIQPQAGVALTATLRDPDGGEAGMEWQWSSAETSGGTFAPIRGATSASYTPVATVPDNPATEDVNEGVVGDEGKFLQVKVTYNDAQALDDPDTADADEGVDRMLTETSANAVREAPATNDAPVFAATMTRAVNENTGAGRNVGDPVTATDADSDDLAYTLSGGADKDSFGIGSTTGQITVGAGTKLNFESAKTTYEVEVKAADPFGESATVMVTIMVMNVDEKPALEGEDPEDYAENGTGPVATYTATDPEGAAISWEVTGADASAFSIEGGVLRFKKSPNYEAPTDAVHTGATDDTDDADDAANNNVYKITVRATEVQADDDESVALSTDLRVTVTVTNEDEDGTVTLSRLVPQVGASGLDASLTDPDGGSDATPPVTNTAISSGITWQWSTAKVSRPELGNDDHWQPAAANQNTGASYTPDANDERKSLRVKASYTDGEGAGKVAYVLSDYRVRAEVVDGDNNEPEFANDGDYTRELPEDTAAGAGVGAPVRATDANSSDILTYVLTGANVSSFSIDKATGQITVASALDFEAGGISGVYTVRVTAYDPSNAMDGMDVTITATDVNEKPAVAGMAEVSVHAEKNSVEEMNTYVALAEAYTPSDGDAGDDVDDLTLSLSGDDADAFELGPITDVATGRRVLTFEAAPNFEAPTDADGNNVYKVTVVATDDEGLTGEQAVTIIVTNVDETGAVTLSSIQPQAGVALTATLRDPDGGEASMGWQWSSAETSGGTFANIEGATSASYTPVATVPDNPATEDVNEGVVGDEGKFLQVKVTYNDAQALDDPDTADADEGVDRMLTETSANAVREAPATNDAPVFAATMTRAVNENTGAGRNVGDPVTATDADFDPLAYTLSGGADKDSFGIGSTTGQITVGAGTKLNFESAKTTYEVEVKAEDPFGESATVMVTIMVMNVDEPPVFGEAPQPLTSIRGDRSVSYDENAMDVVATYEATGTEAASATWSISGADADDFRINNVGELTFATAPDYEAPADADTDNVYEVTVVATAGTATQEAAVTVTVTNLQEEDLKTTYDANGDGSIDKEEARAAVTDYFEGVITKEEARAVITLYFAGSS